MAGLFATFRAGLSLKELPAGHPRGTGSAWWWTPEGAVDLRGVGDGGSNSAVFACIRVKAKGFTEAPARVYDRPSGQWEEIPGHPAETLLARPNPYMTDAYVGAYTMYSLDVQGNAYLAKVRSFAGAVVQLWPLRPDLVTPLAGEDLSPQERAELEVDESAFIGAYEYRVEGRRSLFAVSEMVHLRDMPDPDNPRLGAAPIKTVLREILADEEAGQFAASLVKNMGVPGVILSPKSPEDPGPTEPQARAIKDTYQDTFGGTGRGKPLVLTGGAMDVTPVGFSPTQLDFKTVRRLPEERVAAVTGVPAILAGLGAGLDRSTYANWEQARESLAEDTLSPLWRTCGTQYTYQLGPDYDLSPSQAIRYDTSEVRALQEDKDKAVTRMDTAIRGGWAMVSEGRQEIGLPVDETHEVFLRPTNVIEVGADGMPLTVVEPFPPIESPPPNGQVDPEAEEILEGADV